MPMTQIALGKSKVLARLIILLYGASLLVLVSLSVDAWYNLLWGLPLLLFCVYGGYRHYIIQVLRIHPQSVIGLRYFPHSGDWQLIYQSGAVVAGKIMGQSVVTSAFVLLNFKVEASHKSHVLVWRDAVSDVAYRELRFYLSPLHGEQYGRVSK